MSNLLVFGCDLAVLLCWVCFVCVLFVLLVVCLPLGCDGCGFLVVLLCAVLFGGRVVFGGFTLLMRLAFVCLSLRGV